MSASDNTDRILNDLEAILGSLDGIRNIENEYQRAAQARALIACLEAEDQIEAFERWKKKRAVEDCPWKVYGF